MDNLWHYCSLNDVGYYLGMIENGAANGYGIYFEELPTANYIFGSWADGKLEVTHTCNDRIFYDRAQNLQYKNMSVIYQNIVLYAVESHVEYRSENDFTKGLLCKHHNYILGEFTIKEYFIEYWPLLHGIFKTMNYLNILSQIPSSLEFKFAIYNPQESRLNFSIVTEPYVGTLPENIIKARENIGSVIEFAKLLTEMHLRKIAHNDINLETLVYVEGSVPKVCFNDFSKCQAFSNDISYEECLRYCLFTLKRDFKAPEVFSGEMYNAFASDVYSAGLVILSIILGENLGLENSAEIRERMVLNQNYVPPILFNALEADPNSRCKMSTLLSELSSSFTAH